MLRWLLLSVLPLALLSAGCAGKPSGPKSVDVKGKVTLDGAPLASGRIVFEGEPGVPAGEFEIKDGAYAGQAQVGPKTVRLYALKDPGPQKGQPKGPGYDTMKTEIPIPAKYNTDQGV